MYRKLCSLKGSKAHCRLGIRLQNHQANQCDHHLPIFLYMPPKPKQAETLYWRWDVLLLSSSSLVGQKAVPDWSRFSGFWLVESKESYEQHVFCSPISSGGHPLPGARCFLVWASCPSPSWNDLRQVLTPSPCFARLHSQSHQ